MRDIGDDEQRRARPQPPCALRVPAARQHLRRCRSSAMYRIACVAAPCSCRRGARNATYAITRIGSKMPSFTKSPRIPTCPIDC